MKKYLNILFGALAIMSIASCAKEEKLFSESENGVARSFTCSFDQTKTTIAEGKTVWALGDSIWVSNGRGVEHFGITSEFVGKKNFTFTSKLGGAIYVVYPLSAVDGEGLGLVDDKIVFNVPANQDGTFGSANISVCKTYDETVVLENITAVLKFTIPDDALIPVKAVILHANGNALSGICTVDLSSGAPVISAAQTGSDVFIPVEGLNDSYYASVIPGTYSEGFSLTALTTALQVDSKVSTSSNEVKVNDMIDLGNIGKDLKKLNGDGSAANPWQINNLGEMLAFAYHVNAGNEMEGQSVKLFTDVEGYSLPIGYYDEVADKYVGFKGSFDGGSKTIKVDINGKNCRTPYNVGLFSVLLDGASVKDLTVAGVVAGADTVGAVAGQIMVGEKGFTVSNVKNKAKVSGRNLVAGLFGYLETDTADVVTVDDCSNDGAITATGVDAAGLAAYFGGAQYMTKTVNRFVNKGAITASASAAGAVAYSYFTNFNDCENSGVITSTETNGGNFSRTVQSGKWVNSYGTNWNRGTGGLLGYMQNSSLVGGKNTAAITGYNKTGGIVGVMYWGTVNMAINTGKVTTTGAGVAGGIASWMHVSPGILNSVNEGDVESKGGWNGGIVGYAHSNWSTHTSVVNNCKNSGKVSGTTYCGGIAGNVWVAASSCKIDFNNNTNTGDITGSSYGVGGIAGYVYDATGWAGPRFYESSNSGAVKGTYYVGGICGFVTGRVIGMRWDLRNCVNNGDVTATRTDAQPSYSGGIIGCTGNGVTSGCGLMMDNVINNGNVYYTNTTYSSPRVGGLVGQGTNGQVRNCVNTGKVGPVSGAPSETQKAHIGALYGYVEQKTSSDKKSALKSYSLYAKEGTASILVGNATNAVYSGVHSNNEFFNEAGVLANPALISDVSYTNVVEALNAYRGTTTSWFEWIAGPRFAKPVGYNLNLGDQNLDLGNGGNI